MIALLLACADPVTRPDKEATDTAPAAPIAGYYAVEAPESWEGCDLDDPATRQPPEQLWRISPRGTVLAIYPNAWDTLRCDLDGLEFSCDRGSWAVEGRRPFSLTYTLDGAFDGDRFEAVETLVFDCADAGCDDLRALYGDDLDPCTATATYTGALEAAE